MDSNIMSKRFWNNAPRLGIRIRSSARPIIILSGTPMTNTLYCGAVLARKAKPISVRNSAVTKGADN
ncbi:hypothetical protein D3C72_2512780 [compost metagenome]